MIHFNCFSVCLFLFCVVGSCVEQLFRKTLATMTAVGLGQYTMAAVGLGQSTMTAVGLGQSTMTVAGLGQSTTLVILT